MLSLVQSAADLPCPAPFNLAHHVLFAADADDKTPALIMLGSDKDRVQTYGMLRAQVAGLAGAFLASGMPSQARILIRLGNSPDFPLVYLAAIWAGYVPVPTSAALTVPEITAIARQVDPALIIAGDAIALPEYEAPVIAQSDLAQLAAGPAAPCAMGDPETCAYIVFTSGTSGTPRGVMHAHRAIWARRMMVDGWTGLRAGDRLLHAGAFNWTYTLGVGLLDPWANGATALIPAAGTASAEIPALLQKARATIFAAAPGVFRQMLRAGMPDLPALRHGLSAGEKLPETVARRWRDATGTQVHEAFGMSECSTFLSGAPNRPAPTGTSGYAQPGRRIALLGPDDTPVPQGSEGVIAIDRRDNGLMLGYLGDTPLSDEPWFRTGDIGMMEPDGAVRYLGRADDMLNAGGIRVSPLEIETALNSHPLIHESAAIEQPVDREKSILAAFYTSDGELDPDQLHGFLTEHLAPYKIPRKFTRIPSLPKSGNGKVNRKALRTSL